MTALRAEGCGGGFAAIFIKKGRGWRRGLCRRGVFAFAQGATAALPLRVVVSPLRAMSIKSALRDLLSVSYDMISTTVISHLRWLSPFGALWHHLPAPLGSVSHDSQVALLPYESCSLATAVSVGRQKESAFMGRLGALLRPTCTSYAGCAQWTIKLRKAIPSLNA